MEYSVQAYLKRESTEKLEKFVQDYRNNLLKEDFSNMIDAVIQELTRRKADSATLN